MIANSGISGCFKGLPFLNWQIIKHVSSAFTGDDDGTHGDTDSGSAVPTYTIFTVTGTIAVLRMVGICNTDLVGAATYEVGFAGNTPALIEQIADATAIDDGDVMTGGSGPIVGGVGASGDHDYVIVDGADIIETVGAANVDSGQINYYLIWAAMDSNSSVVEAGTLS